MPPVFLHADAVAGGVGSMVSLPLVIGAAVFGVAIVAAWRGGPRGGLAAAVAGVALLATGLAADLFVHTDQAAERTRIMTIIMVQPQPALADRLHELEDAEARNPWHLLLAAGQGLLVGGLAGLSLMLWLRGRDDSATRQVFARLSRWMASRARAAASDGAQDWYQCSHTPLPQPTEAQAGRRPFRPGVAAPDDLPTGTWPVCSCAFTDAPVRSRILRRRASVTRPAGHAGAVGFAATKPNMPASGEPRQAFPRLMPLASRQSPGWGEEQLVSNGHRRPPVLSR